MERIFILARYYKLDSQNYKWIQKLGETIM